MKTLKRIGIGLVIIPLMLFVANFFVFSTETTGDADKNYEKYFNQNYKIFSLNLPTTMEFAGEAVPLHDLDIRERLDREMLINTYWQSQTLLFHKRANRWFPTIEAILKKNGVPEDFKYLAVIESGLMNVQSPAGATGYWQFMERTARDYGLVVNGEVDERFNVEKSTEAACKYLKQAYKKYKSWTLAAASYNMGMGGLNKQIRRQKASDYYGLLLNSETARYVFRIMAVKEIMNNATKYGFHLRPKDLYPEYQSYTVSIDASIADLAEYAHKQNISYRVFKVLNPWLRDNVLRNKEGRTFLFKLPKEGESFATSDNLEADYNTLNSIMQGNPNPAK